MKRLIITNVFLIIISSLVAQESLLKLVEDSLPVSEKVSAAFKSTRVINAHSIETLAKGNLDFRILHRFGPVNGGVREWFGLDHASMRMAFDYGITDNLMIGIGRSTYRKEIDGFFKTRLLRQSRGDRPVPFSLLFAAGMMIHTEQYYDVAGKELDVSVSNRAAYYVQLIAGRKFSEKFSLQLSPIFVRKNMLDFSDEGHDIFAFGGGARYKITKRMAITADYHHPFSGLHAGYKDPLSLGIDIETGGHVFQLHFSNAIGMNERAYLTETNNDFFNGDIRFGFNLSRIFKIGRRKA